jgi:hypothetical protein
VITLGTAKSTEQDRVAMASDKFEVGQNVTRQTMNDREQQVRERAYCIWEAEGRPDGRAEIHWAMAEIAIAVLSYLSLLEAEGAAAMGAGNESKRSIQE